MGLQERLDALQPRERRLLAIFVGLFVVICVLLIPLGVSAMLADKRSDNEQLRETIERLFEQRDEIEERLEANERVLSRYKSDTPPLAGLIDRFAKEHDLEIPEFKDRPAVPQGKKYEERSTEISIRKVGMRDLALFLEKIAKSPYPISITRLSVRKRGAEQDSWDVNLTVSSYHRIAPDKSAKKSATDSEAQGEATENEE